MRLRFLAQACVGLLALPLMVAPHASAEDAPEQCSLWWGLKQSYRSYITGPVAKGGWGGAGIGFGGDPRGDGAFVFTPAYTEVDGDTVTMAFDGRLKFSGHNYGGDDLLDMTLSDFRIRAHDRHAEILVDYISYESDMSDTSARGERIDGDDIVLANVQLDHPIDPGAEVLNLSGSSTLSADGKRLFLAYEEGEPLDTLGGEVRTSGCPSADSLDRNTIVGKFSGFDDGILRELQERDSKRNREDYQEESSTFADNYREYQEVIAQQEGQSSAGNSGGSVARSSRGGNIVLPDQSSGGSSSGSSGGQPAPAASPDGGAQVDQCKGKGITKADAAWGVKRSFQSYIRGSIAKGSWELSRGASYDNQEFKFPGKAGAIEGEKGQIKFNGQVSFSGHHGVLDLRIQDPEIHFNGKQGTLYAVVNSSNMEGTKINFGRVALGTLSFSQLSIGDNEASGKAEVSLSQAGADAFANFYEPGSALDPISFTASLGGEAVCDVANAPAIGGASGSGDGSDAGDAFGSDEGEDVETAAYDSENKFRIKKAAGAANEESGGLSDYQYLFLALASLLVVGGSFGRLVVKNPV